MVNRGIVVGASEYSAIEMRLIQDWTEILHLKEVGIHDHFFDVGGDSLSAMRCISRMREAFGVEFLLEEFFLEEATIAKFAQTLEELKAGNLNSLT